MTYFSVNYGLTVHGVVVRFGGQAAGGRADNGISGARQLVQVEGTAEVIPQGERCTRRSATAEYVAIPI